MQAVDGFGAGATAFVAPVGEPALRGDAARALIRAAIGRRNERRISHPESELDQ
ncbi:hypothetical protein ACFXO9_15285 [Nocardia tengchongensis]|uniref:hypothetical protein n=1 Tax=Nocardia tengchongensis TaxID=2055889 RepID=UPI00368C4359